MSIDHAYAELGLPVGASESEVKAAWRRLVSRWHPDRNPSREALHVMQRINTAYEFIRTTGFGDSTLEAEPAGDSAGAGAQPDADADAEGPARTVRRKVRLSLEEAALGVTRVLRGRVSHACVVCAGAGVLKLRETCGDCRGSGTVRSRGWYGWLATQSTCTACGGEGTLPRPCPACDGAGRHTRAYRHSVRLPAGVRDGDVLSVRAGADAPGAAAATLELHVAVAPHPFFRVDDDGTLRCEMPVDAFAWIAEAWIDVPTLSGLHHMRLRRGRHAYRLRGQGLPVDRRGTRRGDYLVTIVPTFPEHPAPAQLALLEQLAASAEGQPPAAAVRHWRETIAAWERARSARRA